MFALLFASLLFVVPFPQEPSVPNPDPTQPESPFDLTMPGDSPTEAFGEPPSPEEAFLLRGVVVEIEPELLTLRRRGEIDADLTITPETSIFLGGESVSFDELPLGSMVEVQFVLRGTERVALEIRVPEAE